MHGVYIYDVFLLCLFYLFLSFQLQQAMTKVKI